jgi:hypothetical protein
MLRVYDIVAVCCVFVARQDMGLVIAVNWLAAWLLACTSSAWRVPCTSPVLAGLVALVSCFLSCSFSRIIVCAWPHVGRLQWQFSRADQFVKTSQLDTLKQASILSYLPSQQTMRTSTAGIRHSFLALSLHFPLKPCKERSKVAKASHAHVHYTRQHSPRGRLASAQR